MQCRAMPAAPGAVALQAANGIAASIGLILGNAGAWHDRIRSPDDPDGIRMRRSISERRRDAGTVEGDVPRTPGSRVPGPPRLGETGGWWRPVIRTGVRNNGD